VHSTAATKVSLINHTKPDCQKQKKLIQKRT